MTPSSGDLAGGYDITIVGQNFGPDDDALPRGAKVGDKDALPIRWSAPEVLLVRVPAAPAPGTVDVTLSIDGVSTVLPNAFTYSSISGAGPGALPARLELAQNGPNPFAAAQGTEIRFGLPAEGVAILDVFDTRGRLVKRLASGVQPAGMGMVRWDGRDNSGRVVAGGVYLYRLRAAAAGDRAADEPGAVTRRVQACRDGRGFRAEVRGKCPRFSPIYASSCPRCSSP